MTPTEKQETHLNVSRERWQTAQAWEEDHWRKTQTLRARFGKNILWRILSLFGLKSRYRGSLWAQWWWTQFNGYSFLPDTVDSAVELGCGPYTNFQLIYEQTKPRRLVFNDPLIKSYVDYKMTFLAHMVRRGACELNEQPLETKPFAEGSFDLAVLINVLDHVQDADACLDHVMAIVKPGGWLLVGQDLTNQEDLERPGDPEDHIGHPIKIEHTWLDERLPMLFESEIHSLLPREAGRAPDAHYGTYVFAGRRRA